MKRAPKAKPGELKMGYGKMPGDAPDLCFAWGDGCSKRDGNLMHYIFCGKRQRVTYGNEKVEKGPVVFDPSFVEELEARGYDITTLRFSIMKKTVNAKA